MIPPTQTTSAVFSSKSPKTCSKIWATPQWPQHMVVEIPLDNNASSGTSQNSLSALLQNCGRTTEIKSQVTKESALSMESLLEAGESPLLGNDNNRCLSTLSDVFCENSEKPLAHQGCASVFAPGVQMATPMLAIHSTQGLSSLGTSGNSSLLGTSGNSSLLGASGNLSSLGTSGNSSLLGASGNSSLLGASGNLSLLGASGNSSLLGASGNSSLLGASGNSTEPVAFGASLKEVLVPGHTCTSENVVAECQGISLPKIDSKAVMSGSTERNSTGMQQTSEDTQNPQFRDVEHVDNTATSAQVLVKNTFLQLNDPVTPSSPRNRTESADAVLLGARNRKLAKLVFPEGFTTVFEDSQLHSPVFEDSQLHSPDSSSPKRTWTLEEAAEQEAVPQLRSDDKDETQPLSCGEHDAAGAAQVKAISASAVGRSGVESVAIPLLDNSAHLINIEAQTLMTSSIATPSIVIPPIIAETNSQHSAVPTAPSTDTPVEKGVTTMMLRNIPNKYSQQMLQDVVNEHFRGLYDFFYLPIDFRNKCNVGYAFINFVHPHYAELFKSKFHGYKLSAFKSNKVCEVSSGRVQGLKANIEHYRNSAVMSIPVPQYKPMLLQNGMQVPFPDADGPLPSVKLRPQKC